MLILTRKIGERIVINGNIVVELCAIRSGNKASIGIMAPSGVEIMREELLEPKEAPKLVERLRPELLYSRDCPLVPLS